jgi:hypothetical protein
MKFELPEIKKVSFETESVALFKIEEDDLIISGTEM